jgi:uncharacterized protein YpuA (DUF1002 family)
MMFESIKQTLARNEFALHCDFQNIMSDMHNGYENDLSGHQLISTLASINAMQQGTENESDWLIRREVC